MLRRLWRRLGRRGCALLFLAFLDLVYSFSLFAPPASTRNLPTMKWVSTPAPLWVWALGWGLVGVVCLVFAFRREDSLAWGAAMLIKVLWGGLFLAGWLLTDLERAYVSAVVWLAFAAFVGLLSGWPEPDGRPAQ